MKSFYVLHHFISNRYFSILFIKLSWLIEYYSIVNKDKQSLNTTRCGKLPKVINTTKMNTPLYKKVKMSLTRGQSAWHSIQIKARMPSETTRSAFYSVFTKTAEPIDAFHKWLVGVVDGDGTFYFAKTKKGNWTFCFKVSQSIYNLRLLYFIKKMLQVGSVSVPNSKDKTAEYRIRNISIIDTSILPIFDKYTLLTSKQFNYEIFRKALIIYKDDTLSYQDKNQKLVHLKSLTLPEGYMSKVWYDVGTLSPKTSQNIISKEWLVGFTEAEGSFYLVKKGFNRMAHVFEITQKRDRIVLEGIALILSMKIYDKNNHFTCVTTNRQSVEFVIDYFEKTMKGMKSLEFRI